MRATPLRPLQRLRRRGSDDGTVPGEALRISLEIAAAFGIVPAVRAGAGRRDRGAGDASCKLHCPWARELWRGGGRWRRRSAHAAGRWTICNADRCHPSRRARRRARRGRRRAGGFPPHRDRAIAAGADAGKDPLHRHQLRQPQCRLQRSQCPEISKHVLSAPGFAGRLRPGAGAPQGIASSSITRARSPW